MDKTIMLMVLHLQSGGLAYDYVPGDQCRNAQIALDAGRPLSVTFPALKDGRTIQETHAIREIECLRRELQN
jgi:hypothetical protein